MLSQTDKYLFAELESHIGHDIDIVTYVGAPRNVSLECNTCGAVIIDYEGAFS